jgi:hypothetical protein
MIKKEITNRNIQERLEVDEGPEFDVGGVL